MGVTVVGGGHPLSLLDKSPMIVKNPGIPYHLPILIEAQKRGLKIVTEVELSYLVSEAPIIAVTGTNGKTTTTSLIGDMFSKSRLTDAYLVTLVMLHQKSLKIHTQMNI